MLVASDTRARPFVFTFGNTHNNSNQGFYRFDATVPRQLSPSFPCAASLDDTSLPLDQVPELMNPETHWTSTGQLTPKSVGRVASHHRGSSLSSLGSAGPASPYTQTTSNPRIAITDSAVDGFPDITASDVALYSAATKPLSSDRFYPQYPSYGRVSNRPTDSVFGVSAAQDPRSSRGLLPAPEFPIGNGRSNPVSVASSIASESPATPLLDEPEIERRQKNAFSTAPKLDRTMTDVYEDGLYNPDMTITSASPHTTSTFAFSAQANHDMFAQRLHAANSQHLSATHSPMSTVSSEMSPFRHGSPLAPNSSLSVHGGSRYRSVQQVREHQQAEEAADMVRRQMAPQSHDTEMSTTISPQDSLLEFQEQEGDTNFPLFPSQESHFGGPGLTNGIAHTTHSLEPSIASHDSSRFQYLSHPTVPQHYPFVPNAPASAPMTGMATHGYDNVSNPQKPSGTNADGGTYTCTYHGCTLRFETPVLLQKHKREGHRQVHGLTGSRRADGSRATAILNSQAGPHKCERINPSTGKPCNTIFSRPYDLTRHEDTIHNAKKQKVRCNLCTEEKTFSRADALTRHYRVCHPEVELPGKHRKRRGSG